MKAMEVSKRSDVASPASAKQAYAWGVGDVRYVVGQAWLTIAVAFTIIRAFAAAIKRSWQNATLASLDFFRPKMTLVQDHCRDHQTHRD